MDLIFPIIILCIAISFVIAAIYGIKEGRKQRKEIKRMQLEEGLICDLFVKHTAGLPIAEDVYCKIFCFKDRVQINYNDIKFNLNREKIKDACMKTDVEIQNQYVSSAGGAIAGGLLFGPVGALIGGRAKKKTVKNSKNYLIITYIDDNEQIKYLGFDVTNLQFKVTKFINELNKPTFKETTEVNL